MASFDENGKYIKTNWKAGDKITATKLNKIEESIEAVNDNDISRHVEADARLDALEAKDVAHDKEFTNVKNLIADNKAAAELGDYEINSRMTFLENELNEGIEEVHNVASTVDDKIAQGKADMEAMVAEVEADLEGLHAKDEELSEQLEQNTSKITTIISNEVIANLYEGIKENEDITEPLQNLLNDENVSKVKLLPGVYKISKRIQIPKGKQLELSGNNGSLYLKRDEVDTKLFTIIEPTENFTNGYLFELTSYSILRNGFIDCSTLLSGGGILIDFSTKANVGTKVLGTLLYGGDFEKDITGILVNGDRQTGSIPGYGMYYIFDVGLQYFKYGIHILRQDKYEALDNTINGMSWINGIEVYGNMTFCKRYIFFDFSVFSHCGGSSIIQNRIQGGYGFKGEDANLPCVEVCGDHIVLDCVFHDVGSYVSSSHQTVRYKLNNTTFCKILRGGNSISTAIIRENDSNTYFMDSVEYTQINSITLNGATVDSGWLSKTGNIYTINLRIHNIPSSIGWTEILKLNETSLSKCRVTCLTDRGNIVGVMVQGKSLLIVNDNDTTENISLLISYPIK